MKIVFTTHATDMLVERDIERSWVERTLDAPDSIEPDLLRPGVMRAFLAIPENGGRVLRVVYVADGELIRVLTAFFDRNRSR